MKLTTIKLAASAPLLAIMLSACGGTDFSNQAFEDVNATSKALTERLEEVGGYNAENEEYENRTLMSELPADGQASYTGLAEMWIKDDESELAEYMANNETPDVIADLKLEADFGSDNNSVTGTLSNWVVNQDIEGPMAATGELNMENGQVGPDETDGVTATMTAGLKGEIAFSASETVLVEATMDGEFLGDAAEGVAGTLVGQLTHNEDQTDISYMSGTWGAEKDAAAE